MFLDQQMVDFLFDDDAEAEDNIPKAKKRRGPKGVAFFFDDDDDENRKVLPPQMSHWYLMYVENPRQGNKGFEKQFRRRFRMPYASYLELVQLLKASAIFDRWKAGNVDAVGKKPTPIELLTLTSLRYLGRGWTFDDLSESTAISEDVIRVFFHHFIKFGSLTLFDRWVIQPTRLDQAQEQTHEFAMAGMPGAIGSMDATHVILDCVNYRLRQAHLGHKLNGTARTYNIVVNHRRRIMSSTNGHPARWNDKTIVRFDPFVMDIKNGKILDEFLFELYDYDRDRKVIKVKYRCPWLLVDNGYHKWAVTVPPFKVTTSKMEIRFSEWLESMRKDVECTFGILKGRWRILKTGIRIHGLTQADQIWKTCCALHNWLLEIDGLDDKWEEGVLSSWEGEEGENDQEELAQIDRLHNPTQARSYDAGGMEDAGGVEEEPEGHNDTEDGDNDTELPVSLDGSRLVRSMTMDAFRSKLVTHFDIAFTRRELQWPKRNKTVQKEW